MRTPVSEVLLFKGRSGDPRLGEWVKPLSDVSSLPKDRKEKIILLGCPDDQGVLLNRGKQGAKEGPDSIRKHLYRMAPPLDVEWENLIDFYDFGNVVVSDDILKTHENSYRLAHQVAQSGCTLIALGGGHDFAAPNFLGFMEGHANPGLINIDPHLDVRELENGKPHSGTPFRQILTSGRIKGQNFIEFGIKNNRNARKHFAYCLENKVRIHTFEKLRHSTKPVPELFSQALGPLSKTCSIIGATFDMDSCFEAEGTSAAPVLGFSAWELCLMAEKAGEQKKVKLLEIAEVAPPLDDSQRSSRIAAEMIFFFLRARALSLMNSKRGRR